MAAISAGFLMITLDATIVNVALGAIGADLGGAPSIAQWVVDGYTVAFASLLLLAGSLADRIGVRRGFLVGLAVFVLASAACAVASSVAFLIAARVAQGVGAAWLMACSLALIAHTYAEPQARRRALAVWGAVSGVGLASGPVVGGILVASVGWRAIFLANVPVGLAAAWLLMLHADETPRRRRPLDLPGQVLAMFSLAALTAGFINAGAHGWAAGLTLALVISGGLASAAFVLLERTVRRPLIDPAIFRNTTFTTAVAIGFLFNFCLYGSIFCLAVGLERLRGLDALETGFALLPMTVAAAAMALLAGRLVPRLGEWPVLVAGLTSGAAGATLVALNGRRREPRTAARLHGADRLHRTRDARHDGPCDDERAEARAGTLGRRLQHVSTGGRSVGRRGARHRSHRRRSVSLRPAFLLVGLRVRTGSRARRRCSRAYARFDSAHRTVRRTPCHASPSEPRTRLRSRSTTRITAAGNRSC